MAKRDDASDGRVFEYSVIGMAVLVIIFGFLRTRANVAVDMGGSSDVSRMATAVPEGVPLNTIRKMHMQTGHTMYSIDILQQAENPQHVLANHPATLAIRDSVMIVTGWASYGRRPADDVFLTIDGRAVASCRFPFSRPDVALAYNDPLLGKSGFSCTVPSRALTSGAHILGLDIATRTGTFYSETSPTKLIVQ